MTACSVDSLFDVNDPDVIETGRLDSAEGAAALYRGALTDLAAALGGGNGAGAGPGLILASAMLADEVHFGSTNPDPQQMDTRRVAEGNGYWATAYRFAHLVREASEEAAERLAVLSPQDARVGEMWGVSALTHILLGELYCSGVPFSSARGGRVEYGPPLTTSEVFQRALERTDRAAATGGGALAQVLRGRALLNLGQYGPAAAAVASVPTGYEYRVVHSASTPRHEFFPAVGFAAGWITVADRKAGTGLDFASAGDPRVPIEVRGVVLDGDLPLRVPLRHNSVATSLLVASGVEARLIQAEAALQAGDVSAWLAHLNAARETRSDLAPLTDPGSPAAREDLTFRERGFWLFLSGHRTGDLRRLVRHYGRSPAAVFPSGPYHKQGLSYGDDMNVIIPLTERSNPNFNGCLNRDA